MISILLNVSGEFQLESFIFFVNSKNEAKKRQYTRRFVLHDFWKNAFSSIYLLGFFFSFIAFFKAVEHQDSEQIAKLLSTTDVDVNE